MNLLESSWDVGKALQIENKTGLPQQSRAGVVEKQQQHIAAKVIPRPKSLEVAVINQLFGDSRVSVAAAQEERPFQHGATVTFDLSAPRLWLPPMHFLNIFHI